ncbi:MAG: acyl-CoA thioester hydrolase/BAAT C-terminal domain-containing protein [Tissierellia bacterium]|nr:acyl-CoA thioester hydrolase/BAAT C-terminal domain-containing protein [Tissierellia bacterium]
MKKIKKFIFNLIKVIIVIVLLVLIFRFYNDQRYKSIDSDGSKFYENVTNIDLYPTEIKGAKVEYIDKGRFQGFHMTPKEKLYSGVIVCLGGSEGSPNFESAQRLAEEGFETFAVYFFGMKNQSKTLTKIPLEQFEDIYKYIDENIEDKKPLTLLGASKGAEYALNLANKYNEIDNLVLYAPSAYNFSGLDFKDMGSSWTYENKELNYIDISKSSFIAYVKNILVPMTIKSPIKYKEMYETAIDKDLENYTKLILKDEINSDILMIVGEDDEMWDSLEMANIIKSIHKSATICSYKNAGHIFHGNGIINAPDMRIKTGGNKESNQRAYAESNKCIDQFLKERHEK